MLKLKGKRVTETRAFGSDGSRGLARKVHSGKTRLKVKARGRAKKRLDRRGKVKVKVRVVFKPSGFGSEVQTRTVTLKKR